MDKCHHSHNHPFSGKHTVKDGDKTEQIPDWFLLLIHHVFWTTLFEVAMFALIVVTLGLAVVLET
jgi:hypothetical protein